MSAWKYNSNTLKHSNESENDEVVEGVEGREEGIEDGMDELSYLFWNICDDVDDDDNEDDDVCDFVAGRPVHALLQYTYLSANNDGIDINRLSSIGKGL